ncbi:MAG: gliding motility protein GldC [Alphaproteobacteria bacterium]|nr:gliding motility protein GldC [Alphaproteobacteria bacterium]
MENLEKSKIEIDIGLDPNLHPQSIEWKASHSTSNDTQVAQAMLLSLWDAKDKTALRIDLWTSKMMVDEMADFYYQVLIGMSESFSRATQQVELAQELKDFAKQFIQKFQTNMSSKT